MSVTPTRSLAVVTGAAGGLGLELARQCAMNGFDLVVAAGPLLDALDSLRLLDTDIDLVQTDLATQRGVDEVCSALQGRDVVALLANMGPGLRKSFLEQDFADIRHSIDTITGTVDLIHRVGRDMCARNEGRILITGSIAGFMSTSFHPVYNASKAFVDSFAIALRNELKDSGVTVTCLMPGGTDTGFFDRADLLDTKIGTEKMVDPACVAELAFRVMMDGDADLVSGLKNKLQPTLANFTPAERRSAYHRRQMKPGSTEH